MLRLTENAISQVTMHAERFDFVCLGAGVVAGERYQFDCKSFTAKPLQHKAFSRPVFKIISRFALHALFAGCSSGCDTSPHPNNLPISAHASDI